MGRWGPRLSEDDLKRMATRAVRAEPMRLKQPRVKDRRVEWNGMTFGSKAELTRFQDLLLMEKSGVIYDLKRQVPFDLVVNGFFIGRYVADAVYTERTPLPGRKVVEDTKGHRTEMYLMKKKLMRAIHGIDILET